MPREDMSSRRRGTAPAALQPRMRRAACAQHVTPSALYAIAAAALMPRAVHAPDCLLRRYTRVVDAVTAAMSHARAAARAQPSASSRGAAFMPRRSRRTRYAPRHGTPPFFFVFFIAAASASPAVCRAARYTPRARGRSRNDADMLCSRRLMPTPFDARRAAVRCRYFR